MAAANTVVLSSSPLQGVLERTPATKLCAGMSSSPGLPSPSVFFADKASRFGHGSKGSSIQRGAVAGSANTFVTLHHSRSLESSKLAASPAAGGFEREGLENGEGEQPVPGRRKPKAKKEIRLDASKIQKAPSTKSSVTKKPLAEIAAAVVIESSPIAVKGKTSSTKVKGPTQTKIRKGKVTKAASAKLEVKDRVKDEPKSVESADCVPAHERLRPPTEPSGCDGLEDKLSGMRGQKSRKAPVEATLPLGLEDATKRRKDWTPVKNSFDGFFTLESVEATPADGTITAAEKMPITHFGTLLGDYAFAQITNKAKPKPEILRSSSGEALTKRRKLELVATNTGRIPATAKPKRGKSPTKKPQTVTAKATEQFIPIDDLPTNNILGYFEPGDGIDAEGKIAGKESAGNDKRAVKKAPAKAKAINGKAVKAKQRASLLPPEAALDKVKDQNLLFGTSSQLVRDESPTFLRETQQAIKESELADEPSVAALEQGLAASTASGSSNGSSIPLFTTSRSLWSVAARDLEGALQEGEVVDLSITPKAQAPLKTAGPATEPTKFAPPATQDGRSIRRKPDHEWTSIDDEPGMAIRENANSTGLPSTSREGTVDAERSIPRSLAEAFLRERPRSRSPIKKAKASKAAKEPKALKRSKKATQPKEPQEPQEPDEPHAQERPQGMPNYRGFTTADLNKLVTSYGFKAIKRRDDQIKLLEQCWESKQRVALQALPSNVNLPQPAEKPDIAPEPPKPDSPVKKRGRPPKAKALDSSKENEISIDNDSITRKPRVRTSKAKIPKASEQLDDPMDKNAPQQKRKTQSKKPPQSTTSPDRTPRASKPTKLQPPPPPPLADPLPASHHPASPTIDPHSSFDKTLTPLTHAALLAKITQAITTYPPSHNMKRLTWHEKMLLYEPVVLEDLATWLNSEGLGRVNVDDEVGPGVVKEWCEGMSVCCLWRENLRGGTRARY